MKRILFLCTGNSCRSQMAEGFAASVLNGEAEFFSAGLEPKGVHPLSVKVMKEVGVDISKQSSKSLEEIPVDKIDIVVTLCGDAAERCPVFSGKAKMLHWALEDPAKAAGSEEEILDVFRKIRDKIKSHVNNLDICA